MENVISVTNQKGGVGKTTTSINLAASLAVQKKNVLLIDLDPQGNATMGCGVDKHTLSATINDVLLGEKSILEAITPTPTARLDILAANAELTAAEVKLIHLADRDLRLKQALETVAERYDFIIIDCPPSLNMLTINALVASTGVLIPMQCEYYALEGLSSLLDTIEQVKRAANPELKIEGILRTMYDARNRLTLDVSGQLDEHFGKRVFKTVIPRNIRLAEAPSHGMPVVTYDKRSSGAMAYLGLARELTRRTQKSKREQDKPKATAAPKSRRREAVS